MLVLGAANGPMDVAMFTLRQRRTDPAWMGRAFSISMAFNYAGWPVGAAISGVIATTSIEAAIVLAVICGALGLLLAALLVPRRDPAEDAAALPGDGFAVARTEGPPAS
jgi:MFS family permease